MPWSGHKAIRHKKIVLFCPAGFLLAQLVVFVFVCLEVSFQVCKKVPISEHLFATVCICMHLHLEP